MVAAAPFRVLLGCRTRRIRTFETWKRASRGPLPPRLLVSPTILLSTAASATRSSRANSGLLRKAPDPISKSPKGKDSMPELSDPDHALNPLTERVRSESWMGSGNGNIGLGRESRILPDQKPA